MPNGQVIRHHLIPGIRATGTPSFTTSNHDEEIPEGAASPYEEPLLAMASLTAVRMTDAAAPRAQSSKVWERVMIRHWRAEPNVCWSKLSRIRCSYRS
jgi:hypothetical protein